MNMLKMSNLKYVADGFLKDSESLLNDFIKENSTNFTVFATKWKEHNFGLIFGGRDKLELQQFMHEIYELTLGYLQNNTFILQVGAVYLLYALYRNQIITPPVRIRIVLPQWEVIKKLKVLSEKNLYMHLHYVINFLYGNSFDFVAYPVLHGPCTSKDKTEIEKTAFQASFMFKDCKQEMNNLINSNLLEEIHDLGEKYTSLTKKVFPSEKGVNTSELNDYIGCLDKIVGDGPYTRKRFRKKYIVDSELGSRRAKIKANQFSRKALFKKLNPSDSDEDLEPEPEVKEKQVKKYTKRKHTPKHMRKVGRPKKYDLEKMLESDGNESDHGLKFREYIRKRGPLSKTSYLEKYELDIPKSSKVVNELLALHSPEEDTSDSEEVNNTSEVTLNKSKEQKDDSEDQQGNSKCQQNNSEHHSSDLLDHFEDQQDDSDYQLEF